MSKSIGRVNMTGSEEFEVFLRRFSSQEADLLAKRALYDGMKPVADAIRRNLRASIKGDRNTGALLSSLGVTHIRKENGGYNVKVGFHGYDKGGKEAGGRPNIVKARVLEKRTHFFSRAASSTQKVALAAMQKIIDEGLKNGGN